MLITSDLVQEVPTNALSGLVAGLEALGSLIGGVDDCELAVIRVESGVHASIHVLDAELRRRGTAAWTSPA